MRKRKYFIIFALLFVSCFAQAQTPSICNPQQAYFQKHDGTGTLPFDTDKTTKLNNAAIKLVQTIPDAQCANFKVLDYGFTPISQYTKGGYAEDFEAMKLDARGADRKDFYLLFAREVDQNNHCIKIWMDVFLPAEGKFACLTATQRSLIKIRVEKAVAKALAQGPDNNPPTMNAELVGINTMQGEVEDIVNCDCDKGRNHGLCTTCIEADEIESILKPYKSGTASAKIAKVMGNSPTSSMLYDYSIITLEDTEGKTFELNSIFLAFLQKESADNAVLGILTSDEDSCLPAGSALKSQGNRSSNLSVFDKAKDLYESTNDKLVFWLHASKKRNKVNIYIKNYQPLINLATQNNTPLPTENKIVYQRNKIFVRLGNIIPNKGGAGFGFNTIDFYEYQITDEITKLNGNWIVGGFDAKVKRIIRSHKDFYNYRREVRRDPHTGVDEFDGHSIIYNTSETDQIGYTYEKRFNGGLDCNSSRTIEMLQCEPIRVPYSDCVDNRKLERPVGVDFFHPTEPFLSSVNFGKWKFWNGREIKINEHVFIDDPYDKLGSVKDAQGFVEKWGGRLERFFWKVGWLKTVNDINGVLEEILYYTDDPISPWVNSKDYSGKDGKSKVLFYEITQKNE